MYVGIDEGYAVGEAASVLADLADDVSDGFFVRFAGANDNFVFSGEFVARDDAGAMTAQDDSVGLFGEDFPFRVGTDKENRDFFGDAAATADTLSHSGFLGKGPDVYKGNDSGKLSRKGNFSKAACWEGTRRAKSAGKSRCGYNAQP